MVCCLIESLFCCVSKASDALPTRCQEIVLCGDILSVSVKDSPVALNSSTKEGPSFQQPQVVRWDLHRDTLSVEEITVLG